MLKVIAWGVHRLGMRTLRNAYAALRSEFVFIIKPESGLEWHSEVIISMYSIMVSLLRVSTSESMILGLVSKH